MGRWQDKSGLENSVIQATANKRPTVSSNGINGLSAIQFDGVNDCFEAYGNRLGLSENPDLMIFMISAVDSNNSSIDRIFQIGYGPNGKISLSAGSDGWAWRFGDGGEVYDSTVLSQPSLQVWERTDSTNYSASKFYLNGSEQVVASISNGTGLPDDTSTYTQIGHIPSTEKWVNL